MPRSSKERAPRSAAVTLGDVTLEADQYTSGTVKERSWTITDANLLLPAGAYSVHVRHVDPAGGMITVNGEDIGFNRFYERAVRENLVSKEQDFTPTVTINNPQGRAVAISVSYPSSSNVNPDLL